MRLNQQREQFVARPSPDINITVQSGTFAAREALTQLMQALEEFEISADTAGTVELVLAEVLNNIVEHAYPEDGPSGPIKLKCKKEENCLHFEVTDEGDGMPDGQMPVGAPANLEVDFMDLPEGGFGWFLIKDLAHDVTYQRRGWENQLSLKLALLPDSSNL